MVKSIGRYLGELIGAVLAGVLVAAFIAVVIWLIVGEDYILAKHKEVMINNGQDFNKRVGKLGGTFTDYLENCKFEFRDVKSKEVVSVDLTDILFTRGCSRMVCFTAINGDKYAVNPDNSLKLIQSGIEQYIVGCAYTRKEKGMY